MTTYRSPYDCSGRTMLVTGAASGIGRQSAILLSSLGATMVCADRNADGLQGTLRTLGDGGHSLACVDITDRESVADLATACPTLDGLVHAAGVIRLYPLKMYNEPRIRAMTDTNWQAPALLTTALFRAGKIRTGCSIVFVSSIMSSVGTELNGIYAATKGALVALSRCLALEFAPKNVRVNCVSPAFVRTPMLDQIGNQTDLGPFEGRHPLGFGTAEDVANAIAFLVSGASRWITGTNLILDGGYSAS